MSKTVMLPPIDATPEKVALSLLPSRPIQPNALAEAKNVRNAAWKNNQLIPEWVVPESVDLDRFFTRPEIVKRGAILGHRSGCISQL